MLILNFTYPLRCVRVPPGVRVPPVEYHCPIRIVHWVQFYNLLILYF
jgi:hypothetical protein